MLGLYAAKDEVKLYVGRGGEAAMNQMKARWEEAGWQCSFSPGRPQTLRDVYEPVICPECGWAGMNLATHWVRAHPDLPVPNVKLVCDEVRQANVAARAKASVFKVPRSGQLVVHRRTAEEVEVWQIIRVVKGDGALLRRINGRVSREVIEVQFEDLFDFYYPVSRW